jgi:hypothetical protein
LGTTSRRPAGPVQLDRLPGQRPEVDGAELAGVHRSAVLAHARHRGRPVPGGALDGGQALPLLRVAHLSQQHLGSSQDGGEEVVEVVGDAHRQLAGGAQALRPDELRRLAGALERHGRGGGEPQGQRLVLVREDPPAALGGVQAPQDASADQQGDAEEGVHHRVTRREADAAGVASQVVQPEGLALVQQGAKDAPPVGGLRAQERLLLRGQAGGLELDQLAFLADDADGRVLGVEERRQLHRDAPDEAQLVLQGAAEGAGGGVQAGQGAPARPRGGGLGGRGGPGREGIGGGAGVGAGVGAGGGIGGHHPEAYRGTGSAVVGGAHARGGRRP